jgi:hypothetical protein
MKICKQTLKEIAINGTGISPKVKSHLAVCDSCARVYRKETELENFLLSAKDLDAPENLKHAILNALNNRQQRRSIIPSLGFALKVACALIILISGFWLGLQTANNINNTMPDDFDITEASHYKLNTEPIYPEDLGEIYFVVLEEKENGKK